jgi:hypothetical protein
MSKANRKLKNLLLMPKIQLRYSYYLLALVAMPLSVLLTYSVLLFHKLNLSLELMNNLPIEVIVMTEDVSQKITLAIVIIFLSTSGVVLFGTISISHRFVGPIYVINRYIEAMKKGDYSFTRDLRKDDEMKETLTLLKELGAQLSKPQQD